LDVPKNLFSSAKPEMPRSARPAVYQPQTFAIYQV
jgi:hypothetical protein